MEHGTTPIPVPAILHDPADGIFKLRGKVVRSPLSKDRIDSFESIHPSVAARVKGGAAASPGPYESHALNGIDLAATPGKLLDREAALQWSPQDVKPAAIGDEGFLDQAEADQFDRRQLS
jgi:hypothetical protein